MEEEFIVVDSSTQEANVSISEALASDRSGQLHAEMHRVQMETTTSVHYSVEGLYEELVALRQQAARIAREVRAIIVAAGSIPLSPSVEPLIEGSARFAAIAEDYGVLAHEHTVCALQVHVGVQSENERIAVLRAARPWLPALLALTASSPFWCGADTGYSSFRNRVWRRWPTAGLPPIVNTPAEYATCVRSLQSIGCIRDSGSVYWDVRLSHRYPTVEIRIMDACPSVGLAAAIAAICRSIAACEAQSKVKSELVLGNHNNSLEAAIWIAARYGLTRNLVSATSGDLVPAATAVEEMLRYLEPTLRSFGDLEFVTSQVHRCLEVGGSAGQQRYAASRGSWQHVIAELARQTVDAP